MERLNAGAQTVEALRVATERAEVAETNFKAAEDELEVLVTAAGFDTSDGGPMLEDVDERVFQLVRRAVTERTVRVRILAEVDGVDTYELGVADLTREGHKGEFAGLLRAAADEFEQEGRP